MVNVIDTLLIFLLVFMIVTTIVYVVYSSTWLYKQTRYIVPSIAIFMFGVAMCVLVLCMFFTDKDGNLNLSRDGFCSFLEEENSANEYSVYGDSMSPTLNNQDVVVVTEKDLEDIEFNDIVVFTVEEYPNTYSIKRVIGTPGDEISIENNIVYRNGKEVEVQYNDLDRSETFIYSMSVLVKEGELFVLGDNYNNSIDSRIFGCIPVENIKGVVKE